MPPSPGSHSAVRSERHRISQSFRNRVDIPCDEKKVRVVLRVKSYSAEVYRGQFQLGQALTKMAPSEPLAEDGQ